MKDKCRQVRGIARVVYQTFQIGVSIALPKYYYN